MARQIIDTSPPTGTPAPTAFNMVNAMTAELYPLATGALQKTGGVLSGDLITQKDVIINSFLSPNGQVGYRMLVNISDTVDGGYTIQRVSAGTWSDKLKINYDGSVVALSFNPTSSADIKDYIEGYAGDADEELDRLAVVTYRLRPEFSSSTKVYVGLLAENLKHVRPDAAGDETHYENVEVVVGEDSEGNDLVETQQRLVPMSYDLAQVVALNTRAHQQKSRRIRVLEQDAAELRAAVAELRAALAELRGSEP